MSSPLLLENIWLQQQKYEDAELLFRQTQSGVTNNTGQKATNSLAQEIAQVRQDIQKVLSKQPVTASGVVGGAGDADLYRRVESLENEREKLWEVVNKLTAEIRELRASAPSPAKPQGTSASIAAKPKEASAPQKPAADDDDDLDLFGSDDEESKALKEKRVKEYAEKKAKKPVLIAKSSVILDVKPWDDETDMAEMERRVRSIVQDGLLWGASKLVPVGYGIKKLSIMCVVEDEKVSIEELSEKIAEENEDLVQSVDVAAFNKI